MGIRGGLDGGVRLHPRGHPIGLYHYTGLTRGQEIFLSNVPFFDSLSFVFLAYAAFCLARFVRDRVDGAAVVVLAGVLLMLLDVVIDPLAVLGERWFLGHVFDYAERGLYFGVPLSNFAGWLVVGWSTVGGFLAVSRGRPGVSPNRGAALYYGVLVFSLVMTWWIGEVVQLIVGLTIHVLLFMAWMGWRHLGGGRSAGRQRVRAAGYAARPSPVSGEGA